MSKTKLMMLGLSSIKHNKYLDLYCTIIDNRLNNCFAGYTENHHIIPSSFGGSDDSFNRVDLSAREHFICHYLLTKFTEGNLFHKAIFAFNMMSIKSCFNEERYINSRLYSALKDQISNSCSERNIELHKNPEFKQKFSTQSVGKSAEKNCTI